MDISDNVLLFAGAHWCWLPELQRGTPGIYLFRRVFEVGEGETVLRIGISSDNRHTLFLDGERIGRGPCRSDLQHYSYDEYEFQLDSGMHVLTAEVAVFPSGLSEDGNAIPEMHAGGGFLLGGGIFDNAGNLLTSLSTGQSGGDLWRCCPDRSRSFSWPIPPRQFHAIPPTEECFANFAITGWHDLDFDDSGWLVPVRVSPVIFRSRMANPISLWWLARREIPPMEEFPQPVARVLKVSDGIDIAVAEDFFIHGEGELAVPPGMKWSVTLDLGHLTTAFFGVTVSGQPGSRLDMIYSESMWLGDKKERRSDPAGEVVGYGDRIHPVPARHSFETFWFRTCRFVRIDLDGTDAGMILHNFSLTATMYPFDLKAAFDDGQESTRWIWETAWRTARLCAHEHYEDCPYYEQLQYVGDTRIQALISYALTGDGRLGRQALRQFDASRLPEGITQSRYPSNWPQVIPGFSLYWVMMINDYYRYFADTDLVRELLPGVMSVLDWFERLRREDDLLDHPNYWNFIDWLPEWDKTFEWGWGGGTPVRGTARPDSIHALQYAEACRQAASLSLALGETRLAGDLTMRYRRTVSAVNRHCFDKERQLYLDIPGEAYSSQHANAWAILSDAVPKGEEESLARRLADTADLSQASLYFTFYLFRTWEKAGTYDLFWRQLEKWNALRDFDLSTFPEVPDARETRSDCHAWSSSPLHEYITCVLGIQPGRPGFAEVLVKPHFGVLSQARGRAPVGDAMIDLAWERAKNGELQMDISFDCPKDLRIVWPDGSESVESGCHRGTFHWIQR